MRKSLLIIALTAMRIGFVDADEPLEPPTAYKITSPSKRCWVELDPEKQTSTAYRTTKAGIERLWAISGWYRTASVSGDCRYFVAGYDGVNLLELDYAADTTMLSFYRDGAHIKSVRLNELICDLSKLERTASHWSWGQYIGVESDYFYRVETVEGASFLFDMRTGTATKAAAESAVSRPSE